MKKALLLKKTVFLPQIDEPFRVEVAQAGSTVFFLQKGDCNAVMVMYNGLSKWIPSHDLKTAK